MRPQQQNRRMRGRNNNNNNNNNNRGKGGNQNPLARSYESNGPDVKIRGNAQQIAEKYTTLGRDAMSSGDRVMAENYLQHAEHYNRIIAAYQAQLPNQNFQQNRDDFDDEEMEDGEFERQNNGFEGNQQQSNGSGPQPVIDGVPAEIALNGETNGNGANAPREPRDNNGRDDRREFRGRRDRQNGNRNGEGRREFQRRDEQEGQMQPGNEAATDESTGDNLPDFLTGGAQPRIRTAPVAEPAAIISEVEAPAGEEAAPRRTRRPRRGEKAGSDEAAAQPALAEAQPAAEE